MKTFCQHAGFGWLVACDPGGGGGGVETAGAAATFSMHLFSGVAVLRRNTCAAGDDGRVRFEGVICHLG